MNESLDATGLLLAAATLIDRANAMLDATEAARCQECGRRKHRKPVEAKVYESTSGMPERLRASAQKLATGGE